ncbi:MAG: protein kinase [Eubacteriales bacterium]|nr:protein kinase [Eubacteriales bacterium]
MEETNIKIWPDWIIAREIGRGSFGRVYEIHRRTGSNLERAALKVIRVPSSPLELEQLQMSGLAEEDTESYLRKHVEDIMGEIVLMQRFVGYSNIVSYADYKIDRHEHDVGWDILIRMELLTPLSDYMSTHSMSEKDVVKLGSDISEALVICHGAGIIHRDIKPQNIFINNLGFYKLGDFGISRPIPGSGSVLSFKGTVPYMAPETFAMRGTDERSDIYSLALVLYRLLNGNREPFLLSSRFTPEELYAAQGKRLSGEPLPRPANCSGSLWRILEKALSADPAARYQTAEMFHQALLAMSTTVRTGEETWDGSNPAGGYTRPLFPETEVSVQSSGHNGNRGVQRGKDRTSGHSHGQGMVYPQGPVSYYEPEPEIKSPRRQNYRRWLIWILSGTAAVLAVCILVLLIPSIISGPGKSDGSGSTSGSGTVQTDQDQQTSVQGDQTGTAEQDQVQQTDAVTQQGGNGSEGTYQEDLQEDTLADDAAEIEQTDDSGNGNPAYTGGEGTILPDAEFVDYTVICQDEEGSIISTEIFSGIRGNIVTISAPEIDGYTPQTDSISLTLSGNEDDNTALFIYSEKAAIPEGALHFNGHSYFAYVSYDDPTFWEAVEYCRSLDGYMAVINSDEENTALYDYVFYQLQYPSAYFGYTDEGNSDWYWVGANVSGYKNWLDGQPDHLKPGDQAEHYALFYYKDTPYKWNNGDFGPDREGKVIFLIEWDHQ